MMCRYFLVRPLLLAVAIALSVLSSFSHAQETTQAHVEPRPPMVAPAVGSSTPMHFDVNLVLVNVTVTDEKSRPVLRLRSDDFNVFEENQQQQIRYFSNEDVPISIGLVIDFSLSMTSKIDLLRDAVREFFVNANPLDDYYVVAVSSVPKLLVSGTHSIHEIENKLAEEVPAGTTALNDSVDVVLREMKHSQYERRAVVIISDGGDNSSHNSLKKIVKIVEESDADVYAVGIFDAPTLFLKPLEVKLGQHNLIRMTDATGGRTICVDSASRVPGVIADLSKELRSQYVLAYRPTNLKRDGRWRKVKVRVVAPNRLERFVAHFKKSYQAPLD